MLALLLLCFLPLLDARPIFIQDQDYTFAKPSEYEIVYAEFSKSSLTNKQFFAANFLKGDAISMEVFIPVATKDEIVVTQLTKHTEQPLDEPFLHDSLTVVALKKKLHVQAVAEVNTTVVIEISGRIKGAHYAVSVGKNRSINFLDWTLFFAYIVQRTRIWTRTFYFPFIFLFFTCLYLLLWPLSRSRAWSVLPKISALAYLSWIIDTMLQFFVTIQFSSEKSILTFLVHIVPNAVVLYLIVFSNIGKSNKQKEVFLGIGISSLFIGGAGGYVGAFILLFSGAKKYLQYIDTKKTKEKLICKV